MIIEKISIKSFGKLTDVSLEFSSGINIIEGQNEAGKSTIAAFIKYMLYGFDNEDSDKDLSERNKRIKGVNCDVKHCVYHNGKSECYAEAISIGPCDANCSANTLCATFKPKEY